MSILAIDDTDSRTLGMCTTYVGHLIAERLKTEGSTVHRVMLIRLNPAAKHKTRGNAAVAIHTDAEPQVCLDIASEFARKMSADSDDMTNPGVVVCPDDEAPDEVQEFTDRALKTLLSIDEAEDLIDRHGFLSYHIGNGRGRIGCLAAIGAWDFFDDWTYECIKYRYPEVRGTDRKVDLDSVFERADQYYPEAWDTVDRVENSAVCIPNTPGPILYGIRGDEKNSVEKMAEEIVNLEDTESYQTFITNQGTDEHIVKADQIEDMSNNTAYQVSGKVIKSPETHHGGHVFFEMRDESGSVDVAAFEPTKHFRDKVRNLRVGDEITVQGEYDEGTIKTEKLCVDNLNETRKVNPTCPDCQNSMSSAGANQGYRCRSCGNHQETKDTEEIYRELSKGWHEVPPCARRHIAKPLIRGGFERDTHPFK